MAKSPCSKDCPNRAWDCHGKCEKYLEYYKQNEAEREKIFEKKKHYYILNGMEGERYIRLEKFKRGLMKPRKDD